MITASKAREVADVITTPESQSQLSVIDKLVWDVAVTGAFQVDISTMKLSPCVVEFLRREGYNYQINSDSGGYVTSKVLSW